MLHEQIVGHKRVFAELHFHGDSIFDEIRLVIGFDRIKSRLFDPALLLVRRQANDPLDQFDVLAKPIDRPALHPAMLSERIVERFVEIDRREEKPSLHALLFGPLCAAFVGIDGVYGILDLVPKLRLVNLDELPAVQMRMEFDNSHGQRVLRLNGKTSASTRELFADAWPPLGFVGSYTGLFIGRVRSVPSLREWIRSQATSTYSCAVSQP